MPYNIGLKTKTFGGENSILDSQQVRYIRGGLTVDKTKVSDGCNKTVNGLVRKILEVGTFLAKVTASGKYTPAKVTTLAANALTTDTTLTLTSAKYFQPGDAISVDGVSATIAAAGVNYATNIVTITAQLGTAKGLGVMVKATDGSGDAKCVLAEEVDATEYDQVTTGIDHGRLLAARLPVAPVQAVKDALKEISFV